MSIRKVRGPANPVYIVDELGEDIQDSNPFPVAILEGGSSVSIVRIAVTPVITAGAYTANDALGGMLVFPNAVLVAGGSGRIEKVVIVDNDQQMAPVDLVLFRANFTATNDNNPFDPSNADLLNVLGYISVAATDYENNANNSVACKTSGLQMPNLFRLADSETSLRGQLVVRDAPTYTAQVSITVVLVVRQYIE